MKKLITILLLCPVMAMAQSKKDTVVTPHVSITDSTTVISFKDLQTFKNLVNKLPHDQWATLKPDATIDELWGWILKVKKLQP